MNKMTEIIGNRISLLRNLKELSQEELSQKIGIARSSLTQLENGKRNVQISEIKKLSDILNFSIDEITADDFNIDLVGNATEEKTNYDLRTSPPVINIEQFKNLILYILERCAGKPNIDETALYKLLYFSDFNYYEQHEEYLSGATYRKLPNGPVPKDIDQILKNMVDNNILQPLSSDFGGVKLKRYIPLVNADLKLFNGAEIEVVDKVINLLSGMGPNAITQYSHDDIPYKASKDMEHIDYTLAFSRKPPYSALSS